MKSTQKGLRGGELEKDTYGRLVCTDCETSLDTENDPEAVGKARICPDCGGKWQELG